jgi:hypothetical protein
VHVIVVYGPTSRRGPEARTEVADVWHVVHEILAEIPDRDMAMVLCDANATVKVDPLLTEDEITKGKKRRVLYGAQESQNLNGPYFRKFIEDEDLFPINCRFRQ